jgi:hypothetical protein
MEQDSKYIAINTLDLVLYSAFTDKVERKYHFPAPGWNCMTHRQVPQGFPDTSQVTLHKNNKINLPIAVPAGSR